MASNSTPRTGIIRLTQRSLETGGCHCGGSDSWSPRCPELAKSRRPYIRPDQSTVSTGLSDHHQRWRRAATYVAGSLERPAAHHADQRAASLKQNLQAMRHAVWHLGQVAFGNRCVESAGGSTYVAEDLSVQSNAFSLSLADAFGLRCRPTAGLRNVRNGCATDVTVVNGSTSLTRMMPAF